MAEKSAPLRVLIVDDESLIRWSLGQTLKARGFDVAEASDTRSALAAVVAAGPPFSVVLLDLRLPESNDLLLTSMLRRLVPEARIILMTAYGSNEVVDRALEAGVHTVVFKPFEVDQIGSLVTAPARDELR